MENQVTLIIMRRCNFRSWMFRAITSGDYFDSDRYYVALTVYFVRTNYDRRKEIEESQLKEVAEYREICLNCARTLKSVRSVSVISLLRNSQFHVYLISQSCLRKSTRVRE